jgi:glycosidase
MPDLNWGEAAVRSAIAEAMLRWLDLGVDGFRLDAVRHLVETGPGAGQSDAGATHGHLRELAARLAARRPYALLLGEIWADAATIARYYGSTEQPELGATFDFPLAGAMVGGLLDRDARPLAEALRAIARRYAPSAVDVTFLDNHDQIRLATQLGADDAALRQAAALLLTLPGTPFIYNVDEIGQRNGPTSDDEDKRTPLAWSAGPGVGFTSGTPWHTPAPGSERANIFSQRGDPSSLLSLYRQLIRLRQQWRPLRRGTTEILPGTERSRSVLALLRSEGGQRLLVLHNLANQTVEAGPFLIEARSARPLWTSAPIDEPMVVAGAIGVALPARSSSVWLLE